MRRINLAARAARWSPQHREAAIRELDHRTSDGIAVTLLWNAQTKQVFVAVEDDRNAEWFTLEVRAADALDAFHHPYLQSDHDSQALAPELLASDRPR